MDTMDRTATTDDTRDIDDDVIEIIPTEELEVFNDYLTSVSTALLDIESQDYFHKFIHTEENLNVIRMFVADKQNRSLIVSKVEEFTKPLEEQNVDESKTAEKDDTEDSIQTDVSKNKSMVSIFLDLKINYRGSDTQSIAFIKRQNISTVNLKESRRGIGKQLQVLNLGYEGDELELFRLAGIYVDNGLIPLFASYKSKKTTDESNLSHIDEIEQLLAKLRLEFTHCTQDQISYTVKLTVPPKILEKKEKAQAEGSELKEEDFDAEYNDPAFFDSLKTCLKDWGKNIQKLTYMQTDFPLDSILTEITFWKNRENSLLDIQKQLDSPEVKVVLDLLNKDSTMSSHVFSFLQNINLNNEIKRAQEYNLILKDFPINSLISANDLKSTEKAINDIFSHFKIFKSNLSFPLKRILDLVEALSHDSSKRILKILEEVDLMTCESKKFEILKQECFKIFNDFDKNLKTFFDMLKNKYPKKQDKKLFIGRKQAYEHIQVRLDEIANQRRENEKLLEIVSSVFSVQEEGENRNREAIKDIKDAYTVFLSINVLNMTMEGEKRWNRAKKEYNVKIDRVEEEITSQMRDKLASAKTTNDMFRTFSKFNALFSRPRIRGAIQEYQNQILSSIKKDIKTFRERLTIKYGSSEVCKMYKAIDFPSLSGMITWYTQLQRKLDTYLKRVQAVLGVGWDKHVAGKQLKGQIDPIAEHLAKFKQNYFDNWVKEMNEVNFFDQSKLKIFKIVTASDGSLKLEVNFSQKGVALLREKGVIHYNDFRLPYSLLMKSGEVQSCYPKYISLVDSIATLQQVNSIITPEIGMLLAAKRIKIHNNLKTADQYSWKEERSLEKFCSLLHGQIQEFEDSTHIVLEKNTKKNELLESLTTCDFTSETLKKKMEEIQSITDDFIFNDYSNITKWVSTVNSDIEKVLVSRAETTIQEWLEEFENYGEVTPKYITMTPIHEIKIRDQQLVMDPPVQEMRSYWYKQLNGIISIICGQKKIESMKYEKGGRIKNQLVNEEVDDVPTFKSALQSISQETMLEANKKIESSIKDAASYVSISGCQALWNVDFTKLYEKLEGDVAKWHNCLGGLKQLIKRNFDSAETIKHFGAIVIDYQKAQDQVNNRFNSLQDQIIKKLYEDLSNNMTEFYGTLTKAKSQLELVSLDNPNIDVTIFITEIQEKKRLSGKWEKELEDVYEAGVTILKKKYSIKSDQKLNIDNIRGAWNNFKQILGKKV